MTVFDRLPPELCRDEADMQEMIIRVSKGQSRTHRLGKFIQKVRFEDNVNGSVRARALTPLCRKEPSSFSLSPLGKGEDEGWVEIEVTIDSGACGTVMPTALCPPPHLDTADRGLAQGPGV